MSEELQQLFESSNPKAFAKLFKAGQEEWETPSEFIRRVAVEMAPRLYEKYYDDLVPHSFFGLSCASSTLDLFPEERLWWPCVQQAWLIANSRRRSPWQEASGKEPPGGSQEERWKQFEEAAGEHRFETCQALCATFLADAGERDFFRARSLDRARHDTAHGGLKLIQLNQAWKLAESMQWESAARVLFPALHFLVVGPRQSRPAETAAGAGALKLAENGPRAVEETDLEEFQQGVLYSDDAPQAVAALHHLADQGYPRAAFQEALLLTAMQAMNDAQIGRWLAPVRALLFTAACRDLAGPAPEGNRDLALAALLIQEASHKSRESGEPRRIVDMVNTVCPTDPFDVLRSLVSHSDPYASANTVQAILGMGEESHRELVETLATLAAKNDARIGQGYDLLLVKACAEAHDRSESEVKDRFLVGCGFFLGRLLKDYELFGAYGV